MKEEGGKSRCLDNLDNPCALSAALQSEASTEAGSAMSAARQQFAVDGLLKKREI